MSTTKIEWATKVWNPVTGCTKVSPGCANCYAERFANRLKFNPKLKGKYKNGFKVTYHEDELNTPYKWKNPERIFVCSMSDLFHTDISFEFIWNVFERIRTERRHTFLILTKRPERLAEFIEWYGNQTIAALLDEKCKEVINGWPLPNLWLGVTAEDQERADERIPILLNIPAKVRFISCEPLLSNVDLTNIPFDKVKHNALTGYGFVSDEYSYHNDQFVNWVIAGGETGPNARPTHPDWFRSLRDQCKEANVPFFFKGWGDYHPEEIINNIEDCQNIASYPHRSCQIIDHNGRHNDRLLLEPIKGTHQRVVKIGKKLAGDFLDGKQYHEFPRP